MSEKCFRDAPDEQARIASLLRMIPSGSTVLEIGARDGYITRLLASRLDAGARLAAAIDRRQGDYLRRRRRLIVAVSRRLLRRGALPRSPRAHPPADLPRACDELARVARHVVIGVPSAQDLRAARTRCQRCGKINPPYGHVNRFDQRKLAARFSTLRVVDSEYVAKTREGTNLLSDMLMRLAGYPWGTYDQDEPCISCGGPVGPAPNRSIAARILSSAAVRIDRFLRGLRQPRAKWLHMVFAKDR